MLHVCAVWSYAINPLAEQKQVLLFLSQSLSDFGLDLPFIPFADTPEFTAASVNPVTPVIEGGEVILTCTTDANPKPSNFIIWEKPDSPSTVLSSVYSDGTSTLTLSDIQRDQAGSYRCKANNGIPTSNSDVFSESVIVKVHCKYMFLMFTVCNL